MPDQQPGDGGGALAAGLGVPPPRMPDGVTGPPGARFHPDQGRARLAGNQVVIAYAALVWAMVANLSASSNAVTLARQIDRSWGAARAPVPSCAALVVVGQLGFSPEVEGLTVRLSTCPTLGAAAAHPE